MSNLNLMQRRCAFNVFDDDFYQQIATSKVRPESFIPVFAKKRRKKSKKKLCVQNSSQNLIEIIKFLYSIAIFSFISEFLSISYSTFL